jgi:hypothetical protein
MYPNRYLEIHQKLKEIKELGGIIPIGLKKYLMINHFSNPAFHKVIIDLNNRLICLKAGIGIINKQGGVKC